MSIITEVAFWADTGYTEGCLEIPPIGATLPEPDYVYREDLVPSKDRFFSELQLPVDFQTLFLFSYLRINYSMNNGENLTFYGWIEEVKLKSDSSNFPMATVRWHIDYWRTFNSQATFGFGHVMRGPATFIQSKPWYQNYPYRFKTVKQKITLTPETDNGIYWAIVAYNKGDEGAITETVFAAFPISRNLAVVYMKTQSEENPIMSFPAYSLLNATWDEFFDINPKNIVGTWLSPVCPAYGITTSGGTGTADDPLMYTLSTYNWQTVDKDEGSNRFRRFETIVNAAGNVFYSRFMTIDEITATEENPIIVSGLNAETVGNIPFGMSISAAEARLVASPAGMSLEYRFGRTAFDGQRSNPEGLCFSIALPSFDSNENAWSEYVFSGQREAEQNQRNLNSAWGAIEGAVSTGVGGAMAAGFIGGSAAGPTGAVAGAMLGLLLGATEMIVVNDETQEIKDKYHANQPNSIISAGTGFDALIHGFAPSLIVMEFDDMTQTFIANLKDTLGVAWDYPMPSCQQLIEGGGPLQIANLIVGGNIPVEAKNWIRDKFASGTRIIQR